MSSLQLIKYSPLHLQARLIERLPHSKPFNCVECDFESKTRNNLWTHYMGRHKYTKKWIEEYRQDPSAFDMPADDPVLQSTPPRTPKKLEAPKKIEALKKMEASAEKIKSEATLAEEVISPRLYGGQGARKDFWCDLCQAMVSNAPYNHHFAVVHFKERLRRVLPTSKPHW